MLRAEDFFGVAVRMHCFSLVYIPFKDERETYIITLSVLFTREHSAVWLTSSLQQYYEYIFWCCLPFRTLYLDEFTIRASEYPVAKRTTACFF